MPLSLQSELKAGGVEDVTKPFGICTYLPQLGYSYIEYYKFNPSFVGRKFCQLIYSSIHITAGVKGIEDLRLPDVDCSDVLCHFEQLGGNSSDIVILPTSNLSEPNQSEIIRLLQQQGVMKECYKKVSTDSTIKSIFYILQELKDDENDTRHTVSLQQMETLSMWVKSILLDKSLVDLARYESTYSPDYNCITVPTLKFYESGLDHLIPTVNPLLQSTSKQLYQSHRYLNITDSMRSLLPYTVILDKCKLFINQCYSPPVIILDEEVLTEGQRDMLQTIGVLDEISVKLGIKVIFGSLNRVNDFPS